MYKVTITNPLDVVSYIYCDDMFCLLNTLQTEDTDICFTNVMRQYSSGKSYTKIYDDTGKVLTVSWANDYDEG